jgi:DNA-directed RNA polymerase specialized sigma24 family protein
MDGMSTALSSSRLSDVRDTNRREHHMHELTAREIAQLLGESLTTIKIRLHRARRKLSLALKAGCAFSHDGREVLVCESKD